MKISVIIPAYNRELYIKECVDSVLGQTFQNFEILLVDDGSTDQTVEICQGMAKCDSRIRVILGEHKGVSAARNQAIDAATGDCLFFLDSDDVIHPELLDSMLAVMEKHNVPIVITKLRPIQHDRWNESLIPLLMEPMDVGTGKVLQNDDVFDEFFAGKCCNLIGGVLIRKDYVGQTRFCTELCVGEDAYFMYENLLKGGCVAICEKAGYFYRMHWETARKNMSFNSYLSRYRCNMLLWRSEEQHGRMQHVNQKKNKFFYIYLQQQAGSIVDPDVCRQIRKHIKTVKKELWPAINGKQKLQYYLTTWVPGIYNPILRRQRKRKIGNRRENHK